MPPPPNHYNAVWRGVISNGPITNTRVIIDEMMTMNCDVATDCRMRVRQVNPRRRRQRRSTMSRSSRSATVTVCRSSVRRGFLLTTCSACSTAVLFSAGTRPRLTSLLYCCDWRTTRGHCRGRRRPGRLSGLLLPPLRVPPGPVRRSRPARSTLTRLPSRTWPTRASRRPCSPAINCSCRTASTTSTTGLSTWLWSRSSRSVQERLSTLCRWPGGRCPAAGQAAGRPGAAEERRQR